MSSTPQTVADSIALEHEANALVAFIKEVRPFDRAEFAKQFPHSAVYINSHRVEGETILHLACIAQHNELIDHLIFVCGANTLALNERGLYPFALPNPHKLTAYILEATCAADKQEVRKAVSNESFRSQFHRLMMNAIFDKDLEALKAYASSFSYRVGWDVGILLLNSFKMPDSPLSFLTWLCQRPDYADLLEGFVNIMRYKLGPVYVESNRILADVINDPASSDIPDLKAFFDFYHGKEPRSITTFEVAALHGNLRAMVALSKISCEEGSFNEIMLNLFNREPERSTLLFSFVAQRFCQRLMRKGLSSKDDRDWRILMAFLQGSINLFPTWFYEIKKIFDSLPLESDIPHIALARSFERIMGCYVLSVAHDKSRAEGVARAESFFDEIHSILKEGLEVSLSYQGEEGVPLLKPAVSTCDLLWRSLCKLLVERQHKITADSLRGLFIRSLILKNREYCEYFNIKPNEFKLLDSGPVSPAVTITIATLMRMKLLEPVEFPYEHRALLSPMLTEFTTATRAYLHDCCTERSKSDGFYKAATVWSELTAERNPMELLISLHKFLTEGWSQDAGSFRGHVYQAFLGNESVLKAVNADGTNNERLNPAKFADLLKAYCLIHWPESKSRFSRVNVLSLRGLFSAVGPDSKETYSLLRKNA